MSQVRKDKLTIVTEDPLADPDVATATTPVEEPKGQTIDDNDGCDTSDDEGSPTLRRFPNTSLFWSDTTAFATATSLQASLRKKRALSTRKVTRSGLAAEARGAGTARAVDYDKRESKRARLEAGELQ